MVKKNMETYTKNIKIILSFLNNRSSSTLTFEIAVNFICGAKSDSRRPCPIWRDPFVSAYGQ